MEESLVVSASDGYALAATHYRASDSGAVRVVVAGATGVPQGFYRRIATFLEESGHPVVTFDFRGIGRSKQGALRGFQASALDWGQLDLEAVVNWSLERGPTLVVGHSLGGHLFGLLSRANETRGLYTFGTGSGWHGFMPILERPKVLLLWSVLGPIATRATGYLPAKRLGLGEDLPLGVYEQWRRWCGYPRYFFDDPEFAFKDRFASIRVPIVAVNALDDRWAPPVSRDAFIAGYSSAPITRISPEPRPRAIGHMGYFRPGPGEPLWEQLAQWLRP